MEIKQYINDAMRTAKPLPTKQDDHDHAVIGMITELGEIATAVKRSVIYKKGYTAEIIDNVEEEAGDFLWYWALASHTHGISYDIVFDNDKKLDGKPRSFSSVILGVGLTDAELKIPAIQHVKSLAHLVSRFDLQNDFPLFPLGSMLTTVGALLLSLGLDIDKAAARNIAKLRERFPGAYSDQAAEARADKGGVDARNS